jgi:hypothetical protein
MAVRPIGDVLPERSPWQTLVKGIFGNQKRVTHELNNTTGGSSTVKNSGLLLPAEGFRIAGRFLARCPAAGDRQEQEGLQTRQDCEKKLVFFEL